MTLRTEQDRHFYQRDAWQKCDENRRLSFPFPFFVFFAPVSLEVLRYPEDWKLRSRCHLAWIYFKGLKRTKTSWHLSQMWNGQHLSNTHSSLKISISQDYLTQQGNSNFEHKHFIWNPNNKRSLMSQISYFSDYYLFAIGVRSKRMRNERISELVVFVKEQMK